MGYKRLDFPTLKLSITGGRPFSAGGHRMFRTRLLSARFDLTTLQIYPFVFGKMFSFNVCNANSCEVVVPLGMELKIWFQVQSAYVKLHQEHHKIT